MKKILLIALFFSSIAWATVPCPALKKKFSAADKNLVRCLTKTLNARSPTAATACEKELDKFIDHASSFYKCLPLPDSKVGYGGGFEGMAAIQSPNQQICHNEWESLKRVDLSGCLGAWRLMVSHEAQYGKPPADDCKALMVQFHHHRNDLLACSQKNGRPTKIEFTF